MSCVTFNPHAIPRTERFEKLLLVRLMNSVKKSLESQVTITDHFYLFIRLFVYRG